VSSAAGIAAPARSNRKAVAEAIGFWNEWDQRTQQRLIGERFDLVDQFVRWCRNRVRGGVELDWRITVRRFFRRSWRNITRQKTSQRKPR